MENILALGVGLRVVVLVRDLVEGLVQERHACGVDPGAREHRVPEILVGVADRDAVAVLVQQLDGFAIAGKKVSHLPTRLIMQ